MTARDFIDRLVGGHLQDHGHGEAERRRSANSYLVGATQRA